MSPRLPKSRRFLHPQPARVSGEKAIQMLQGIFPLTVYLDLYRRRNNGPTLEKLSSLSTVG